MTELERREVNEAISAADDGLNLPKHMAAHIYMFSGESVPVTFVVDSDLISELVDWFGKDFTIIRDEGATLTIRVNCNEKAMRYWVLQYGPYVEVIRPDSLKNQIKHDISDMYEKYGCESDEEESPLERTAKKQMDFWRKVIYEAMDSISLKRQLEIGKHRFGENFSYTDDMVRMAIDGIYTEIKLGEIECPEWFRDVFDKIDTKLDELFKKLYA